MAWYRCFVRGEDFPLQVEGGKSPLGFYTTRFAEAQSPGEAESLVLDMLKNDPSLYLPPGTPGMEKARVYFEEIVEVAGPGASNAGFTFFSEDD
jgi:hypothetical protein